MDALKELIDLIISTIDKKATVFNDFSETKKTFEKDGKPAKLMIENGKILWYYQADSKRSSEFYWIFSDSYSIQELLACLEELWDHIKYKNEEEKLLFELHQKARKLLKDIIDSDIFPPLKSRGEDK